MRKLSLRGVGERELQLSPRANPTKRKSMDQKESQTPLIPPCPTYFTHEGNKSMRGPNSRTPISSFLPGRFLVRERKENFNQDILFSIDLYWHRDDTETSYCIQRQANLVDNPRREMVQCRGSVTSMHDVKLSRSIPIATPSGPRPWDTQGRVSPPPSPPARTGTFRQSPGSSGYRRPGW